MCNSSPLQILQGTQRFKQWSATLKMEVTRLFQASSIHWDNSFSTGDDEKRNPVREANKTALTLFAEPIRPS